MGLVILFVTFSLLLLAWRAMFSPFNVVIARGRLQLNYRTAVLAVLNSLQICEIILRTITDFCGQACHNSIFLHPSNHSTLKKWSRCRSTDTLSFRTEPAAWRHLHWYEEWNRFPESAESIPSACFIPIRYSPNTSSCIWVQVQPYFVLVNSILGLSVRSVISFLCKLICWLRLYFLHTSVHLQFRQKDDAKSVFSKFPSKLCLCGRLGEPSTPWLIKTVMACPWIILRPTPRPSEMAHCIAQVRRKTQSTNQQN